MRRVVIILVSSSHPSIEYGQLADVASHRTDRIILPLCSGYQLTLELIYHLLDPRLQEVECAFAVKPQKL